VKIKKILFLPGKHPPEGNFMGGIDCAHFLRKNYLDPNSGNGIGVRPKKEKFSIFALIHQLHSLNQVQESVFMLQECAQSIPRIKLPLYESFLIIKISFSKSFFEPKNHKNALLYSPCTKMILLQKTHTQKQRKSNNF
jgi:hypothetical protein